MELNVQGLMKADRFKTKYFLKKKEVRSRYGVFSERGMNIFASNYTSCSLSISMRDSRFVLRPPRPSCDRDLELTIFWVNVRFLPLYKTWYV